MTICDEHMWLIPFTSGGNHVLTITLKEAREITGLRLWNYNKSQESTYRGVVVAIDDYRKIILKKKRGSELKALCHRGANLKNFVDKFKFT